MPKAESSGEKLKYNFKFLLNTPKSSCRHDQVCHLS